MLTLPLLIDQRWQFVAVRQHRELAEDLAYFSIGRVSFYSVPLVLGEPRRQLGEVLQTAQEREACSLVAFCYSSPGTK